MGLHDLALRKLHGLLEGKMGDEHLLLHALHLLAKYRSTLIANTWIRKYGKVVGSGPFRGLELTGSSTEGCSVPKLIGCYESELHAVLERAIARNYESIINVGCAEGYYAVGLALRSPMSRVFAFDVDPRAQSACRSLAELNSVSARVEVGGRLEPEGLARFSGQRALVVCDIEGAEKELLSPAAAPSLRGFDLIVEVHEAQSPGVTQLLRERFSASHAIELISNRLSSPELPRFFHEHLTELDQLLAVWEWRISETPWLVMTTRTPS